MNPREQTLNSQNPRPQAHSSGGQPRERAPGQGPSAPEEESTGAELGGPPRLLVSCRPSAAPHASLSVTGHSQEGQREKSERVKRQGPILGTHLASVHGGWVLCRCQGP